MNRIARGITNKVTSITASFTSKEEGKEQKHVTGTNPRSHCATTEAPLKKPPANPKANPTTSASGACPPLLFKGKKKYGPGRTGARTFTRKRTTHYQQNLLASTCTHRNHISLPSKQGQNTAGILHSWPTRAKNRFIIGFLRYTTNSPIFNLNWLVTAVYGSRSSRKSESPESKELCYYKSRKKHI